MQRHACVIVGKSCYGFRLSPLRFGAVQSFGGYWRRYEHASSELGCTMTFHIFLPPAATGNKSPVRFSVTTSHRRERLLA